MKKSDTIVAARQPKKRPQRNASLSPRSSSSTHVPRKPSTPPCSDYWDYPAGQRLVDWRSIFRRVQVGSFDDARQDQRQQTTSTNDLCRGKHAPTSKTNNNKLPSLRLARSNIAAAKRASAPSPTTTDKSTVIVHSAEVPRNSPSDVDVLVGANTLQDDTNISGAEDTGQLQAGERSSSGIAQSKLWTLTSGTRPDTVPCKRISPAGTETRAESDPRAKLEWTLPGLPGQDSLCVGAGAARYNPPKRTCGGAAPKSFRAANDEDGTCGRCRTSAWESVSGRLTRYLSGQSAVFLRSNSAVVAQQCCCSERAKEEGRWRRRRSIRSNQPAS
ncbi:hypothetical protein CKAH01_05329 [Colletotrichum kahawae]|uniref:Uncharacterized protein n=1 Tax=Colletotrichum kahawae TaxID=34407 RepID=A0AAD9YFD9_COLKA|nr:hypothetical protein CKAH01_05329 [Colletotrichum kahawae]